MRESFDFEGTSTGEYRGGLYVNYCGKEYPAVYLGVGRFVLYSDYMDEIFTFPTDNGKYILQTDLRDENITCASDIQMIGIVKNCYESVIIRDICEEGVIASTYNPRLAFELSLKPIKELGFTGLIERKLLIGIYEERDYLWNPSFGMYSTFCQAIGSINESSWYVDKDRMAQIYILNKDEK